MTPDPNQRGDDPDDSPWGRMAREIVRNPDSPASLAIQSSINRALRPSQEAADRLVEAFCKLRESPEDPVALGELDLAKANWESVCRGHLDTDLLEQFRQEGAELFERRRRSPPEMSKILRAGGERRDFAYELAGDLTGLQGIWHRLWALISLQHGFAVPDDGEGVDALRAEFESRLGRRMDPAEWDALRAHAHAHAERTWRE